MILTDYNFSDSILTRHFPANPEITTQHLLSNLSGVMINTDNILDYARPQPPNFINVGGLQIKKHKLGDDIPRDMARFIDQADQGLVLFTMGFIFNAKVCRDKRTGLSHVIFCAMPANLSDKHNVTEY